MPARKVAAGRREQSLQGGGRERKEKRESLTDYPLVGNSPGPFPHGRVTREGNGRPGHTALGFYTSLVWGMGDSGSSLVCIRL